MTPEEQAEVSAAMRAARAKARGYADFFGWATDRDLEELNVLTSLFESMERDGTLQVSNLRSRGRGSDPPDCEALDRQNARVAIEVTELVDGKAIQAFKAGSVYEAADWEREKFLAQLSELLRQKDVRFPKLRDPPYKGGFWVVVFTDEPALVAGRVASLLEGHVFVGLKHITEAVLLLSYDPGSNGCPYFRLRVGG